MDSLIRWRKEDYSNLRKAVNSFNRKVRELEALGLKNLPEQIEYTAEKQDIVTRKEFNRRLNEIRKFQNRNQAKFIALESGEVMTRWERDQLLNARKRAENRLSRELMELENDISVGTGNVKANEIRGTLKSFERLGKVKDKRLKERILSEGKTDVEMKRALQFQRNFIKAFNKMHGKYSRTLVEWAKSYSNPMEFWEAIKDTPLSDIQERYDSTDGIIYLGVSESEVREYYMKELRNFII